MVRVRVWNRVSKFLYDEVEVARTESVQTYALPPANTPVRHTRNIRLNEH